MRCGFLAFYLLELASAAARAEARTEFFVLTEWPPLAGPSRVYAVKEVLEPPWGLPFSRPMPMPIAREQRRALPKRMNFKK